MQQQSTPKRGFWLMALKLTLAWGACVVSSALFAQPTDSAAAATAATAGNARCIGLVTKLRTAAPGAGAELLQFLAGYSSARYTGTTRHAVAQADPFFGQLAHQTLKWFMDWCSAQPERQLADAAERYFDELPGAGPAAAARAATTALGLQTDRSSSCSARDLGACAGCNINCSAPQQAQCMPGRELRGGAQGPPRCGAPSHCSCR